ncbi:hypothetical protein HOY80DRAFT_1085671 [Tuber brumale]|nr:hypothetical protein HOY80DRAFT_1085671 [Tuber brumale]
MDCRGKPAGYTYLTNPTGKYFQFPNMGSRDTNIPQNISEMFQTGASGHGNLISGPFDVRHRLFRMVKDLDAGSNASMGHSPNQGKVHTEGVGATVQSVILDHSFVLVEGLIVDAKSRGVGFRNHSPPPNLGYGGTWEESLLWVEPVSQCDKNNLAVDFTLAENQKIDKVRLNGRGGSVDLVHDEPNFNFNRANSKLDIQF